jgi:hypothetical protein
MSQITQVEAVVANIVEEVKEVVEVVAEDGDHTPKRISCLDKATLQTILTTAIAAVTIPVMVNLSIKAAEEVEEVVEVVAEDGDHTPKRILRLDKVTRE